MWQTLVNFAQKLDLPLTPEQAQTLVRYAQSVWQKKDFLNLTSAAGLDEILTRHICDGLQGAAWIYTTAARQQKNCFSLIDAGSGAGYIGLTVAAALPNAQVTLVESLEKRCAFLNWTILNIGLKNVQVKQVRLGEKKDLQADFVTERAMGQLPDILGICLAAVKPGGYFVAYQGENSLAASVSAGKYGGKFVREIPYLLPCDTKKRQLAVFEKEVQ